MDAPIDGRLLRIPLDALVTISTPDGQVLGRGRVSNISGSGILMASGVDAEVGDVLHIEVMAKPDRPSADPSPLIAIIRITRIQGDYPGREIAGEFTELNLP